MRERKARRLCTRAPEGRSGFVLVAAGAKGDPRCAGRIAEGRRRIVRSELHRFVGNRRARRRLSERARERAKVRSRRRQQGRDGRAATGAAGPRISHVSDLGSGPRRLMNALTRPLATIGRATVHAVEGIGYAGMLLFESLYFAA